MSIYCPRCGSDRLDALGEKSALDHKPRSKCFDCGLVLTPPRGRFGFVLLMVAAVAIGGSCVVLCVGWLTGRIDSDNTPERAMGAVALGCLVGPLVAVLAARELFAPKPVARKPVVTKSSGSAPQTVTRPAPGGAGSKCLMCDAPIGSSGTGSTVCAACRAGLPE